VRAHHVDREDPAIVLRTPVGQVTIIGAALGVKLLVRDIRTADDLPAAFDTGAREAPKVS